MSDYHESQRMRIWWVWLVVGMAQLLLLWGLIQQVFLDIPWGKKPTSDAMLIVSTAIVGLVIVVLFMMKLETIINSDGIHYRFPPFQWKWKRVSWDDVNEVHVIHYSLLDYGGWGSRWGGPKKGWGFCVSGNRGVQFRLDNGTKIMLGTRQPDKVENYLESLEKDLGPGESFLFAH